jgi:hypothetical protein
MSFPVFKVAHRDYTTGCTPIGQANDSTEALALLAEHLAGTGSANPVQVELKDQDVGQTQVWGYWPVWRV